MKRIVFSLLMLSAVTSVLAQKATKFDKDDVTKLYYAKKYTDAKDYIDKVLQNPKEQGNKDALTYKAAIYAQLSQDSATKASNPDGIKTANEVLLQLQLSTDTAQFNKLMREDAGINAISSVYASSFNQGKDEFTQSQWDNAFSNFHTAAHWANYITQNGFSQNPDKNAIDTFTVLYTGFAAQNASGFDSQTGFKNQAMADSAMAIYTQLADRKIATPDMAAMYQFMIQYYQYKKDDTNASKYISLAKQYYPDKNALWAQLETQAMLSGGGVDDIIKNYKTKDATGEMTEDQYAQIANSLANAEKQIKDTAKLLEVNSTAIDAFGKAFAKDPNNGLYAYNIAVLNYGVFNTLDDQYYANKGESAALKAKRSAIEKQQQPLSDTAIYWFDKAYTVLAAKTNREQQDNVCGNNSLKSIANLYNWKMSKAQGHDPAAYTKYEALYNKYSAMEDSLK
ncbi:MAG TPA: hypothetical protein VGB84_07285 [Arachidicoccus sp.]